MTFLKILALALTAIVLMPSAAHFFELPGKIDLDRDAYFTVQGIYAGWALFAVPIFAAIAANAVLFAALRRGDPAAARWALASAALIAASLAIFFTWTFPANQATANWTAIPENWETLRREWEYSHAANALVIFAAIAANAVLFVALRRGDPTAARWALASAALIAASLAIFFTWTFPANQATANWTAIPENWETLRREWEYSHAANALVVFAAFLATAMATVRR